MEPITAIMLGLKIVSELSPILLPKMVSIAKAVKGLSNEEIMTIEEFEASITATQAKVKKWDDPII